MLANHPWARSLAALNFERLMSAVKSTFNAEGGTPRANSRDPVDRQGDRKSFDALLKPIPRRWYEPDFRNCLAAKERKEMSGGMISVGSNLTAILQPGSAPLSLRSLAAYFGFRDERLWVKTAVAAICLGAFLTVATFTPANAADAPTASTEQTRGLTNGPASAPTHSGFADRGQSMHERELAWVLWIQQAKFLAWPMRLITNLGPSKYLVVLLPFVFFCLDRRSGAWLALVYFIASGLRESLAATFCFPRPFWIDPRVDTFHYGQSLTFSYSFPSGHAWVGTSVWLFAASRFKHPLAWGAGLIIAISICFSRVFLGVHFPSDVAAGFIFGAILVLAILRVESPLNGWVKSSSLGSQCGAAAFLSSVLILGAVLAQTLNAAMPDPSSWAAYAVKAREFSRISEQAGAVLGLGIGLAMNRRWARFEVSDSWVRRLGCWVLGCAPLGIIYGARLLGSDTPESLRISARFLCFFLATWLMTFVVPWLGLRWKLLRPAAA